MPRATAWLVLALTLLAPASLASPSSDVTVAFSAPDTYRVTAHVVYTGEDARAYRANADEDQDGRVSPEEASATKARLQAAIQDTQRSDHRLDDQRPSRIDVLALKSERFIGPVEAGSDLNLTFTIDYAYAVPSDSTHTWSVERSNTSTPGTFHLHVATPQRWEIVDHEGFGGPSNATILYDERADRGRLHAAPEAGFELRLQDRTAPTSPTATSGDPAVSPDHETLEPSNTSDPAPSQADQAPDGKPAPRATPLAAVLALLALGLAGTFKPRNNS